ncbi:hypothetical protein [Achromobacter sp. AGC39]
MQNQTFAQAIVNQNAAYIARHEKSGKKPNLNNAGFNPDLFAAYKHVTSDFTAPVVEKLESMGADLTDIFARIATVTNTKEALRTVQFLLFLATTDARYVKASVRTALLSFAGLMLGARDRNGLRYVATGKGDEMTSEQVSNVAGKNEVQGIFGKTKKQSVDTQMSVSVKKGATAGILPLLGMVVPSADAKAGVINDANPLATRLFHLISTAAPSTLALWVGDDEVTA